MIFYSTLFFGPSGAFSDHLVFFRATSITRLRVRAQLADVGPRK